MKVGPHLVTFYEPNLAERAQQRVRGTPLQFVIVVVLISPPVSPTCFLNAPGAAQVLPHNAQSPPLRLLHLCATCFCNPGRALTLLRFRASPGQRRLSHCW
ncbi:Hypothetical predicted protein [Cloeon dipterum]|uniref:Uncharacterized protein n=1 Tax=Cloeon dipterum TaxID=197152 RepID=A0A8S1C2G8_9INSE|nr:Hypothetical predicted protein [Cloeon dipterum]